VKHTTFESLHRRLSFAIATAARRWRWRAGWLLIAGGPAGNGCGERGCRGIGMFTTHLTGMLAYRFPIAVAYNMPTLAISWLGGAFAALAIVYVSSREPMTSAGLAGGSLAWAPALPSCSSLPMAALRLARCPVPQRSAARRHRS